MNIKLHTPKSLDAQGMQYFRFEVLDVADQNLMRLSVSKPRVRQNHHKQGLNQTIEKLSADFRYYKMFFGKLSFYRLQSQ